MHFARQSISVLLHFSYLFVKGGLFSVLLTDGNFIDIKLAIKKADL
jgi:hypothetical protein